MLIISNTGCRKDVNLPACCARAFLHAGCGFQPGDGLSLYACWQCKHCWFICSPAQPSLLLLASACIIISYYAADAAVLHLLPPTLLVCLQGLEQHDELSGSGAQGSSELACLSSLPQGGCGSAGGVLPGMPSLALPGAPAGVQQSLMGGKARFR